MVPRWLEQNFVWTRCYCKGPRFDKFYSHSFNNLKIFVFSICEEAALPTPFIRAQQWVRTVQHCWLTCNIFSWCNYGNQGTYFTVVQKRHTASDVTMETRACSLLFWKKLPIGIFDWNFVHFSCLLTYYIIRSSHISWFNHPDNIRIRVKHMKSFVRSFSTPTPIAFV
jgi:hypothetical protein